MMIMVVVVLMVINYMLNCQNYSEGVPETLMHYQGQPLGGASGALVPGADFEEAPKRRSPTGHTLIRSTVAWRFPHLQTK
jgi:hypothetical protein